MAEQTNVVVLGAGKIGKLVAYLLVMSGDYRLTLVDSNLKAVEAAYELIPHAQRHLIKMAEADFSNAEALKSVLSGANYVVSCAPYHCNVLIAEIAKQKGVGYLDLTEDVATTKAVKELSQNASTVFVPQCGLAPGFITIAANHLASHFDKLDAVKMRVGALPKFPHNRLKYNLTWSTEGLINEYGNPCEAIVDGNLMLVAPLEGHEYFTLDGTKYEAFNTSGGLGTLCETWKDRVQSLDYKSIRYPGHRDIVALLMNDLKLNEDRETLKRVFERSLPHTFQDVVIVFVTVTGWKGDRYSQMSYAKKIYNQEIGGEQWGAIQITTASGICGVLDLIVQKKLPNKGFIKQEDVNYDDFIKNRFGRYYNVEGA